MKKLFKNPNLRGTQIPPSYIFKNKQKLNLKRFSANNIIKPTYNSKASKSHSLVTKFFESVISYLLLLRTYLKPI